MPGVAILSMHNPPKDAEGPCTRIPDFFWIVNERPDPSLDFFTVACPCCGAELPYGGHESTTMGFMLPEGLSERERDCHPWEGNRHTRWADCAACSTKFLFGMSHGNVWIKTQTAPEWARDGVHDEWRLSAGVPSCSSRTTKYTCCDCGDTVEIHHDEPLIHHGGNKPLRFECQSCDNSVSQRISHYQPHEPPPPESKHKGPWKLSLHQAVVIGNSKAISKGTRV